MLFSLIKLKKRPLGKFFEGAWWERLWLSVACDLPFFQKGSDKHIPHQSSTTNDIGGMGLERWGMDLERVGFILTATSTRSQGAVRS